MAKSGSILMNLSTLNNTLFADPHSIFTLLQDFSHQLHHDCMDSGVYEDPKEQKDLWDYLKTITFSLTLILKSIHWCFDDRDIPVMNSMYGILMEIHFIILEFGSNGFSLWRDCIDSLLLSFHSRPHLLEQITRHYLQSTKCLVKIAFIMSMISYTLHDFSESFLEWVLLSHSLPFLKLLLPFKTHYKHRKQVMNASLERIFDSLSQKTRYQWIIKKIWPYYLEILLKHIPVESDVDFSIHLIYCIV